MKTWVLLLLAVGMGANAAEPTSKPATTQAASEYVAALKAFRAAEIPKAQAEIARARKAIADIRAGRVKPYYNAESTIKEWEQRAKDQTNWLNGLKANALPTQLDMAGEPRLGMVGVPSSVTILSIEGEREFIGRVSIEIDSDELSALGVPQGHVDYRDFKAVIVGVSTTGKVDGATLRTLPPMKITGTRKTAAGTIFVVEPIR